MISEAYRDMNAQLHAEKATYGASGHRWAHIVHDYGTHDVLDYGCGKGTLGQALGFPIKQYDPAIPEHSVRPIPAELVMCTDVLEHIEPEHIDAVLDDIRRCAKRWAFLVVATRPAKKVLPDGRNAHLLVQPPEWWEAKIAKRFPLVSQSKNESQAGEVVFRCCVSS